MALHHPTRTFQIYQIFAANTNLGKTIFSTGLLRAASLPRQPSKSRIDYSRLFYLKPVQTGYPSDSDARFIDTFIPREIKLTTKTLYSYEKSVSPHIATDKPPPDQEVLNAVKSHITECRKLSGTHEGKMVVETAGGVHSPTMSGTVQCDFYRPLRLPVVLVGDGNLGGISATISAFESLRLRGYDIPAILLFHKSEYNNVAFLKKHLQINGTLVHAIPSPPSAASSKEQDREQLRHYFDETDEHFSRVVKHLDQFHQNRFDRLDIMENSTRERIWWPFTQHDLVQKVTVIDSAHGDFMTTYVPWEPISTETNQMQELYDGCSSWWTQGLGHGSSKLSLEASYAAGRYGHVMFPECTHEPALQLAEKLLSTVGSGWASRVFYSDNGSTAIEVALKMALKSANLHARKSAKQSQLKVLGIDGSYHGDTIGAMDACSPNVYNAQVAWYEPKGYWFEPPKVLLKKGVYHVDIPESYGTTAQYQFTSLQSIFDPNRRLNSPLAEIYENHIRKILHFLVEESGQNFGALLMEPVIMGAGGMIFVDPLFQRVLIDEVRQGSIFGKNEHFGWSGLPVIFDEVFTGFWRLGRESGADLLGVKPDIAAYAKLLTGGLLPLATTLTAESIFRSFSGSEKTEALLHGHSYTAHPVGCWVANTSIREYEKMDRRPEDGGSVVWNHSKTNWNDSPNDPNLVWSFWDKEVVNQISYSPNVKGAVALGTVLAITLKDSLGGGYLSDASQKIVQKLRESNSNENELGIFIRPLGNVVYLMTSQISTLESIQMVQRKLLRCLENQ